MVIEKIHKGKLLMPQWRLPWDRNVAGSGMLSTRSGLWNLVK
jgi:hypothetical protein